MPIAEARIPTDRPSRYLAQLCRHADAMNHQAHRFRGSGSHARPEVLDVEFSESAGTIALSWGRCTLLAGSDTLTLRVEAADENHLRQMQDLLTADLERFGRRDDLKIDWQRSPALDSPAGTTSPAPVPAERGRKPRTTILLVALAALAIVTHVWLGATALAAWRWTSVAADVVLAVVVVKLIAMAVIALRHGAGSPRRHRPWSTR